MGLDDLLSTESAVVAAATAAVLSPRTRETMRRGAVLGVAGAMKAGDVVTGAARGVARGVRGEGDGGEAAGGPPNQGATGNASGSRSRRSSGGGSSRQRRSASSSSS